MEHYKVVVYVPIENDGAVRKVIGEAGGGKIGAYTHCSFSSRGIGRFNPQKGSNPAIGKIGKLAEVEEERIEFVCETHCLDEVVSAIRKAHPYEGPVIETWKIEMR